MHSASFGPRKALSVRVTQVHRAPPPALHLLRLSSSPQPCCPMVVVGTCCEDSSLLGFPGQELSRTGGKQLTSQRGRAASACCPHPPPPGSIPPTQGALVRARETREDVGPLSVEEEALDKTAGGSRNPEVRGGGGGQRGDKHLQGPLAL